MSALQNERRPGATLVEVLISIFVMAIGMLALLALFPLGAIRMDQVMRDNRAKHTGENAFALATAMNIPFDPQVAGNGATLSFAGYTVFVNDFYLFPLNLGGPPLPANPSDWSHPVIIDPLGYLTASGTAYQKWVSGNPAVVVNAPGIPRCTPSFVINQTTAVKWFGNTDDILFDTNGLAQFVAPGTFRQNIDYSTAYLCKRPRASDPTLVNVSVLVYRSRPLILAGGTALNETAYKADVDLNRGNVIHVTAAANATVNPPLPNVRVGDWLLDATPMTMYDTAGNAIAQSNVATFYRVVSVNDIDNVTTEYEVHQQLRGYPQGYPFAANQQPRGVYVPSSPNTIIVMEGLAEVFEKGLVRRKF